MRTAFGRHCRYVNIRSLNREDSVLYFPPEAFGSFRVLHQIGAGALGPVFRAHDPGRDRLVAIKVFRLDLTPEQSAALVHELEHLVGKGLNHPSIAAPIAAGLESGAVYLAEEYAVGDALDVVLRERGSLQREAAVHMIEALAEAIDYAADRGVHHGSLHPRDLILSPDGVRLTGLGVASALSRIGAKRPTRPPHSGSPADDLYSLAAIAFEAMSGRRLSAANLEEFGRGSGSDFLEAFAGATASTMELRPARASEFAAQLADVGPGVDGGPGLSPAEPIVAERFSGLPASLMDPAPFPELWNAQPPKPLRAESSTGRWQGRRARVLPLVVLVIVGGALIGYATISFITPRPEPQISVTDARSAIAETVVDLPPANPPAPPLPAPPVHSTPAPSRLVSGAGNLVIRSTPANADVLLDGRARGKTPLTVRDLPLGSYTIRVARDGYATAQRQVRLTAPQSTVAMTLRLRATPVTSRSPPSSTDAGVGGIVVQSRPAGARVYVNEKLIGSSPLAMPGLPAGPATVRIEMDGYRTWATTVRVHAGEQARVGASLDRQ